MGGGGGGKDGGDGAETTAATTSTTTTGASIKAEGADHVATGTSPDQQPALHVIVLGSGGGPIESNVTAFLVRSLSTGWSKGSVVAVDAGVHLSAISRILEETQPARLGHCDEFPLPYTLTEGPFKDLEVPNATHTANAAHIHRSLIDTYLITHPHLDHISGFVVNTAGLPGSRPKRLAGLPSTIAAFKAHIFNNVIWPNLSDENNGAGLVTYMRLVEGGSPALGEGDGRGYLEICDGLAVKIWGVSHGHCIERHSHRGSGSVRHGSFDASTMGPMGVGMGLSSNPPVMSPRALARHNSVNSGLNPFLQREHDRMQGGGGSPVGTAALSGRKSSVSVAGAPGESVCVYDSSAYFIRDVSTGREILIFGDVEPDSLSLSPRNEKIWQEAAPKIANGKLTAIFIECSYDDSQPDDRLYGHLTPKYIAEEMSVLAREVDAARLEIHSEKHGVDDHRLLSRRKAATPTPHGGLNTTPSRSSSGNYPGRLTPKTSSHSEDPVSPKTVKPSIYIPPTRSGPATNNSNPNHAPSSISNDSARNSIDSAAWSAGGAMASVMSKQRSGSGSGSYFDSPHLATPTAELSLQDLADNTSTAGPATPLGMNNSGALPPPIMQTADKKPTHSELPLRGLKVVIIHVKDKLNDARKAGDVILEELLDHERELRLGCEYIISESGQDLYL
ncbi:cAMP phosphodiesterases class-II-domain-containing protein [Rhypophila decipiens]|uniref:cAMP phosphodiesterases class-II-domain-containing protein n=1 Tax=Rhypophila decipiens TaxID=261697 RepID=A0AAN7B2G3_9PEZI|nr:cAMP phosphodiesterases class-II-domain-containing protein [Rhypophila decipiens]